MSELKPLVLKSSQWLRGEYTAGPGSALYIGGRKHQYCCLGVLARECGLPPRKLLDKSAPSDLLEDNRYGKMVKEREDLPEGLRWCVDRNGCTSRDAELAIQANDDAEITDKARLKKLVPIFRRNGWDLQFVDDETKGAE